MHMIYIHNRRMHANNYKTHLCAHIAREGPEVHTGPEGVTECGPRSGSLGARDETHPHKQELPQTTHLNTINCKHIHKRKRV